MMRNYPDSVEKPQLYSRDLTSPDRSSIRTNWRLREKSEKRHYRHRRDRSSSSSSNSSSNELRNSRIREHKKHVDSVQTYEIMKSFDLKFEGKDSENAELFLEDFLDYITNSNLDKHRALKAVLRLLSG